jgi:hypothetical protein
MGQKFTRSRRRREEERLYQERKREEEKLYREIDQSLNEGLLLADKLAAEIFGKPFKSTHSQLNK